MKDVVYHLERNVFLANFHSLHSVSKESKFQDQSADFSGPFQDADATVSFGESEFIPAKRKGGEDQLFNTPLMKILVYNYSCFDVSLFSMLIKHRGKEDCIDEVLE